MNNVYRSEAEIKAESEKLKTEVTHLGFVQPAPSQGMNTLMI